MHRSHLHSDSRVSYVSVCVCLLVVSCTTAQAQPAAIPRSVFASGGEIMSGPAHVMTGTIGQPVIGLTFGSAYAIGQGFWYTISQGGITGLEDVEGSQVGFELGKNYPNPFNPSTTIPFAIARASRVRISIHNIHGQQVALVLDRDLAAGHGTVVFDARSLPTGIYVCRMHAGDFTAERKLMVLK